MGPWDLQRARAWAGCFHLTAHGWSHQPFNPIIQMRKLRLGGGNVLPRWNFRFF